MLACAAAGLGIIPVVQRLNAEYGVFIKPSNPDTLLSVVTHWRHTALCTSITRLRTVQRIMEVSWGGWRPAGWMG